MNFCFILTNDVLLLREKDAKIHIAHYWSPVEPSDMTNKEKKGFNTVEQKKQRAANQERDAKGKTKLKERLGLQNEVYFSPEKITSSCLS